MLSSLAIVDILVVIGLLIILVGASMYSSFRKKNSEEYFMAGRSLRWWSVAGSIFGTNIHAQQIVGMMSVGFSIGFAQSHYEIWAIPAILILTYVFIPIYRKRNYFTLSQFLETRFNANARLAYTLLMVAFITIQLIAGFYIGSRTLGILFQGTQFEVGYIQGIFIISLITVIFTVFGGMESVVIADNILTVIMIVAIILMGALTFSQPEIGGLSGLLRQDLAQENKMHLYLPSNHPKLPWTGIFTGLTVLNFFYWTTNQYQVQRVLAAKTDRDARLGTIAAGFLKLLIPFFSIAAGTAAFYLFKTRHPSMAVKPDDTFLLLLNTVVPDGYGFKGLILAGLTCAIFSAIYSMMNSVSTMMAFDIFKKYIQPSGSDRQTVKFGQFMVIVICLVAGIFSYTTYDPQSSGNFFLQLANQTSYIKPGLVVVFFWGIFWKKTTPVAALIVLIASPLIGLACDLVYARVLAEIPLIRNSFGEEFNFLYRVFAIFVLGSVLIVTLTLALRKAEKDKENDLNISFKGILKPIALFFLVQFPLIILTLLHLLTPQQAAFPASLLTMFVFLGYLRRRENGLKFYESDKFYAGLLTAAMVWIMFFFA